MNTRRTITILLCITTIVSVFVFAKNVVRAQFNEEINYQGKLLGATGGAVADGTYHMKFRLYTQETGGSAIFEENRSTVAGNRVSVLSGLFSVMLGSSTPLTNVDFNQTLWLEVEVGGTASSTWETLTPRKRLGAVPAAFEANNAQTLDGIATTSFLRSDQSDNVTAGTLTIDAAASLVVNGAGTFANATSTNFYATILGLNSEYFTDLTGSGLINNNGVLQVSSTTLNLTLDGLSDVDTTGVALGNLIYYNGASWEDLATSSLNIALSDTNGVLAATRGGTGLSTITQNQLLIGGAGNTWTQIATSTLNINSDNIQQGATNLFSQWANVTGGINYAGGNVGIASSTPWAKFVITNTGSGPSFIVEDSTSPDTTPFVIDASGQVGIGTPNPGFPLEIKALGAAIMMLDAGAGSNDSLIRLRNGGTSKWAFGNLGSDDSFRINTGTGIGTNDLMTLTSGGNLGLGTTSPFAKLSVAGRIVGEYFTGTSTATSTLGGGLDIATGCYAINGTCVGGSSLTGSGAANRVAYWSGTNALASDAGFTFASNLLTVPNFLATASSTIGNGTQQGGLTISGGATTTGNAYVGGSSYLVGNVGIGSTPSSQPLTVTQTANGASVYLHRTSSSIDDYAQLAFRVSSGSGSNTAEIRVIRTDASANTAITFRPQVGSTVTEVMRLDSTGNVGIGTTSPFAKLSVAGRIVGEYFTGTSTATSTLGGGLDIATGCYAIGGTCLTTGSGTVNSGTQGQVAYYGANGTAVTGTSSLFIDTAGNIGVGTTTPNNTFHIQSSDPILTFTNSAGPNQTSQGQIFFKEAEDSGIKVRYDGSANKMFITGRSSSVDTDILTIHRTGNVGIGTTTATNLLHIAQNGSGSAFVRFEDTQVGGTSFFINNGFAAAGVAGFFMGNAQVMSITSSGNVGIGTTSPFAKLSVAGRIVGEYFTGTSTATSTLGGGLDIATGCYAIGGTCLSSGSGTVNSGTQGQVAYYGANGTAVTGTSSLFISTAQNVGIGSSTPWGKLTVTNTGSGPSFVVEDATSPDSTPFLIDAAGNVGIGTPSPSKNLHVSGSADTTARLSSTNNDGDVFLQMLEDSNGSGIELAYIGADTANRLDIRDFGGSEIASFLRSGNVGIGTTSPFAKLSVAGRIVGEYFTGTSTATSTFGGGLDIATGCYAIGGTCLSSGSGTVNSGTQGQVAYYGANGTAVTGTSTIFIDSVGRVGIGTTTPEHALSIQRTNSGNGVAAFMNSSLGGYSAIDFKDATSTNQLSIGWGNSSTPLPFRNNAFINLNHGTGDLLFIAGITEFMRMTAGGNFGIGTSSPYAKLSVAGRIVGEYFTATSSATSSFPTLSVSGLFYDGAGTGGANGTILRSTGSGVAWTSTSSLGLQSLDDDLTALAALSSTGMVARTGTGAYALRTITGTSNEVTVSNGDGVSGNPTLSLPDTVFGGSAFQVGRDSTDYVDFSTNSETSIIANGVNNLTVSATGVGIGDPSSISALLHVNSTDELNALFDAGGDAFVFIDKGATFNKAELAFRTAGSVNWYTGLTDSNVADYAGNEYFIGSTSGGLSPAFLVDSTNNVGIGTTTPWAKLSVNYVDGTNTGPRFFVGSSTANNLIVNAAGNVGVGTSPSASRFAVRDIYTGTGAREGGSFYLENVPTASQGSSYIIGASSWVKTPDSNTASSGRLRALDAFADNDGGPYTAEVIGVSSFAYNHAGSSSNNDYLAAGYFASEHDSGAATDVLGLDTEAWVFGGTVTNLYGLRVKDVERGGGTVANRYGLYMGAFTGSVTTRDYALFSAPSQHSYMAGALGIGTTTPWARLAVTGTTSVANSVPLFALASSTGTTVLQVSNAGALTLSSGATTTANNGVNITAGCYAVNGTCLSTSGGSGTVNTGTQGQIAYYAAGGTAVSGTSSIFIDTAGNVGIGTNSPAAKLHIDDSSPILRFTNSSGINQVANGEINFYEDANGQMKIRYDGSVNKLYFVGRNSGVDVEHLTVTRDGQLGVGSTTPWGKFAINYTDGTDSGPRFVVASSTHTDFIVESTGNVSIDQGKLYHDVAAGETSITNLNLGPVNFEDNAGWVSWIDMDVNSGVATGTVEAYSAQVDGLQTLTIWSNTANDDGTLEDIRVLVGTTSNTVLGSANIPSYSLLVGNGILCVDNGGDNCDNSSRATGGVYAQSGSIAGLDIAEMYPTQDESLTPGDIVSISPELGLLCDATDTSGEGTPVCTATTSGMVPFIKRASEESGSTLGIVTTDPGITLGGFTNRRYVIYDEHAVALAGRVPVKVNGEGGAIMVGDRIALSSQVGVGKKAATSGETVGIALEPFSPESGTSTGSIVVFVRNEHRYAQSEFMIDAQGRVGIGTTTPGYDVQVGGAIAAQSFVNLSSAGIKKDISTVTGEARTSLLDIARGINLAEYHYASDATSSPLRLGLIAEQAPKEILSFTGDVSSSTIQGIDLYKLSVLTLASVQELASKVDTLAGRVTALEQNIQSGIRATSTKMASTTPTTISTLMKDMGAAIIDGVTHFAKLIIGSLTVGSSEEPQGITLFDEETGEPYCVVIKGGALVSREGACDDESDRLPPVMHLNGGEHLEVPQSGIYVDLGVSVQDNSTSTIELIKTVNELIVEEVILDTSVLETYTIVYAASDEAGNTGYATRTVEIIDVQDGQAKNNSNSQENATAANGNSTSGENSGGGSAPQQTQQSTTSPVTTTNTGSSSTTPPTTQSSTQSTNQGSNPQSTSQNASHNTSASSTPNTTNGTTGDAQIALSATASSSTTATETPKAAEQEAAQNDVPAVAAQAPTPSASSSGATEE